MATFLFSKALSVSLVAAVVLALSASSSMAQLTPITYDIVNYPAEETDIFSKDQDSVSGTITASSTGSLLGTYTAGVTGVNSVTLAYDISRASRKEVEMLRERQANVIGAVCNDVSEAMQEYYYHSHPAYYSAPRARRAGA